MERGKAAAGKPTCAFARLCVRFSDKAAHALTPLDRQPPDNTYRGAFHLLRRVRIAGYLAPARLYIHGRGVYQYNRRFKAVPAAELFQSAGAFAFLRPLRDNF